MLGRGCPIEGNNGQLCSVAQQGTQQGGWSQSGKHHECQWGLGWDLDTGHEEVFLPPTPGAPLDFLGTPAWGPGEGIGGQSRRKHLSSEEPTPPQEYTRGNLRMALLLL